MQIKFNIKDKIDRDNVILGLANAGYKVYHEEIRELLSYTNLVVVEVDNEFIKVQETLDVFKLNFHNTAR